MWRREEKSQRDASVVSAGDFVVGMRQPVIEIDHHHAIVG
jgi:hypothetical protein